jgi:hypothetical protein
MAGGHRSRRRGNGMGMNSAPIPGRESAFDTADRSPGQCGYVSEQRGHDAASVHGLCCRRWSRHGCSSGLPTPYADCNALQLTTDPADCLDLHLAGQR